jgi:uncharacterized membrane protein (UPF0127 family)
MKDTILRYLLLFIDANGVINDMHDMNPFQTFPNTRQDTLLVMHWK